MNWCAGCTHSSPAHRADVPVYESIDGGDCPLMGTPATTLPNVNEGSILIVHSEGDDNITRIDIGAPKK